MTKHISTKAAQKTAIEDMKASNVKTTVLYQQKAIRTLPKEKKIPFNI